MLDTMISRMTAVKYEESMIPIFRPLLVMISATSPRVIIPTPIFKQSIHLNLQAFAINPQPITLLIIATITNPMAKTILLVSIAEKSVFRPIATKNTGANII